MSSVNKTLPEEGFLALFLAHGHGTIDDIELLLRTSSEAEIKKYVAYRDQTGSTKPSALYTCLQLNRTPIRVIRAMLEHDEVGDVVDGDDDDGGESNVIEGRATRRWTGTVGLTGVLSVVVLNCM